MSRNEEYDQKIDESLKIMELRDRFAMAALQGLCASQLYCSLPYDDLAAIAYKMADAMIAEREGRTDE